MQSLESVSATDQGGQADDLPVLSEDAGTRRQNVPCLLSA